MKSIIVLSLLACISFAPTQAVALSQCKGEIIFLTEKSPPVLKLQIVYEDAVFNVVDIGANGTPDTLEDISNVKPSDWIRDKLYEQYRDAFIEMLKCEEKALLDECAALEKAGKKCEWAE